jgi:uroporphyrinogen-III synthase
MAVLVTRPEAQGLQLCQLLSEVGISALSHPLISIVPAVNSNSLLDDLEGFDVIIAVSQHAAELSHRVLQEKGRHWPTHPTYVAIGQKTAQILSKHTQQTVHYPEISDSEHLLALELLQSVENNRILILRGDSGRELIFDTLIERMARVEYCEVYQKNYIGFQSSTCSANWQRQGIDTLVVTSSSQLHFLLSQIDEKSRAWLLQLHIVVPSERIATDAKQLGFYKVTNAGSASNSALVTALQLKNRTISNDK